MRKIKKSDDNKELRQKAESLLESTVESDEDMEGMENQDNAGLILELRVHQIELTTQNEELRHIQPALEKSRNRYMHLYDFAPVGYVTLNEKWDITGANLTMSVMLGVERSAIVGKMLSHFILKHDQDSKA